MVRRWLIASDSHVTVSDGIQFLQFSGNNIRGVW